MQPTYQISVTNQLIDLKKHLIFLRITDEVGLSSDTLELILEDTDGRLAFPQTGLKLDVSMGYVETGITPMGQFIINEITCEGPPQTMHIKAHAADFKQSLKVQTDQSWHGTTLGDLVKQIADKHGYVAKVSSALAQLPLPHIDQTAESDIHLLTRLGQQYNAIAKPAGGTLLFMPRNLAQSVSGKALSAQTISYKDVIIWSYTLSERDHYNGVSAKWHDKDTGKTVEETTGSGTTQVLRQTHANKTEAQQAALSFQEKRTLDTQIVNVTLIGRTDLRAETPVTLTGFRADIPSNWIIKRAEHVLDQGGYHTTITASHHLKEKTDEASQPQPPP